MADDQDDFEDFRQRLRRQSQNRPFIDQMEEFVRTHASPDDLKELRQTVQTGRDVSDVVKRERDERM